MTEEEEFTALDAYLDSLNFTSKDVLKMSIHIGVSNMMFPTVDKLKEAVSFQYYRMLYLKQNPELDNRVKTKKKESKVLEKALRAGVKIIEGG